MTTDKKTDGTNSDAPKEENKTISVPITHNFSVKHTWV